ncbi:MAG: hypothetical protein HUJ30_05250, partial [Gammaproteobacteria bacterium]|nr:hypothetical protein [Gammaproteobacteria bacterium]
MIKKWLLLLLALLAGFQAQANEDEELLDPEVAYKISVKAIDANTIRASWEIADGYYMYRDK